MTPWALCTVQECSQGDRGFSLQLALLTELARGGHGGGDKHGLLSVSHGDPATSSVFQNENFQLHLTPPPLAEE